MNAQETIGKLNEILKANGFSSVGYVSAEEHEDGVGACVGLNFIKNGVWYTAKDAMEECGKMVWLQNGKGENKNLYMTTESIRKVAKHCEKMGRNYQFQIVDFDASVYYGRIYG